jgi:hypothetical protein
MDMKYKYALVGIVVLIVILLIFRVKKSTMTASPPPVASNVTPVYNLISSAGKMQTEIEELTKQHILKTQTLTDPAAITNENASYAEQIKKIRSDYEAKIT